MSPSFLDGLFLGHAHPVFDLCKSLLDGIEIRRIWRQEPEAGTGGSDGVPNGFGFVTSQIVHDHNVAGPESECWHEHLFHIGAE